MTRASGVQFSFWYSVNPFTCAIAHHLVFEENEVITFKAFNENVADNQAAIGYRSPTEELMLTYSLGD